MPNYVKNEKGYETVKFNAKEIKEAYSKSEAKKKNPANVNLPEEVITKRKAKKKQLVVICS